MKDIELPDMEWIVARAIPHQDKDCWIIRAQKERKREQLRVQIREYAEVFHLKRLMDEKAH